MTVTDPVSTPVPPPDDLGRAMHVLIHDLRAPVSVAVGYLRLLRERRLPDADSEQRILEQTLESLGRVSRVCDEASGYLAVRESERTAGECPVVRLVEGLTAQLVPLAVPVHGDGRSTDDVRLAVASPDALAAHLARLVGFCRRHAPDARIAVALSLEDGWLRLLVGTPAHRASLAAAAPAPLDPWRGGQGFGPATACLEVARHGGRVWTTAAAWPGLAVALPLAEVA